MGSTWADEAHRRAKGLQQEVGTGELTYQTREARFALRTSVGTRYFSVHDYTGRSGVVDWRGLRRDILAAAALPLAT